MQKCAWHATCGCMQNMQKYAIHTETCETCTNMHDMQNKQKHADLCKTCNTCRTMQDMQKHAKRGNIQTWNMHNMQIHKKHAQTCMTCKNKQIDAKHAIDVKPCKTYRNMQTCGRNVQKHACFYFSIVSNFYLNFIITF